MESVAARHSGTQDALDVTSWNVVPYLVSERVSGRIIRVNPLLIELTGFTAQELQGMTVMELGLWKSVESRAAILRARPVAGPQTAASLVVRSGSEPDVLHGWQAEESEGEQRVHEVIIDLTHAAQTRKRLERLSRFRGVLSQVLRESLDRGLDDSFYERVLKNAVDTIPGAQMASLLVRDPDRRYRYRAAVSCDLELLQTISFSEQEMGVHLSPKPKLYRGYSSNPGLDEHRRKVLDECGPTSSIQVSIVTPVILEGEPVAVFNLDNLVDPDGFDSEALDMARDYAQHLAVLLQRFRLEEALWQQAHYDKLTGLPNRRLFDQLLAGVLDECRGSGNKAAVFFIDLDNFKAVNDTYGHNFGDAVVKAVTERLSEALPDSATLSRWGGDELVALLPRINKPEAEQIAADLVVRAAEAYKVEGITLHNTVSIGLAVYAETGASAEELLQNADMALYRAKSAGRNTFRAFDEELRLAARLQSELRRAVNENEIELHYQPRFDLLGRLTAFEALARWNHPERGLLPASAFIRSAEHAGLIQQLGSRLLDEAVGQARRWLDSGHHVPVAFNMSGLQLAAPAVVQQVGAALRRHALPAHLLELQIAESSAAVDAPDAALKLLQLSKLGVRLLLDGIGGGFSSLAMLRRFRLDAIKINREFVAALAAGGIERHGDLAANDVIQALVSLGSDLGVHVVAEGVETQEQFDLVRQAGVTQVQGFLFGDAVSVREATGLLVSLDSAQ